MTKHYTLAQYADIKKLDDKTLHNMRIQLVRDADKPLKERKYPKFYKASCCGKWVIDEHDANKKAHLTGN